MSPQRLVGNQLVACYRKSVHIEKACSYMAPSTPTVERLGLSHAVAPGYALMMRASVWLLSPKPFLLFYPERDSSGYRWWQFGKIWLSVVLDKF